ncbi:MAG: TIGR03960 family B12-binding radical SAM protein [Cyanobacteria bacterium TGS_CYA1]|nr:TIGR03960 family B12-binding radical SAM protein [Cyanobacteria bacterium TGS_CYA1]
MPVTRSFINNDKNDFSSLLTGELLEQVERPGQYLGNEWGALRKDFDSAKVRLLLSFPDIYELGMSNFGLRILYQIVNRLPDFMADRTYAPASDMEALMRKNNLALWAWESRRPAKEFELMGFSLQYELCYTNVLNMLELAGIPVRASERTDLFPLVFAGGPSTINPEPMAPFFDFFIIGDGEETMPAILKIVEEAKSNLQNNHAPDTVTDEVAKAARLALLKKLAINVPGVYVPALYELDEANVPKPISEDIPKRVYRQVVGLSDANQPTQSLVSYLSLVHDREVLEVRRGCDRGCRFCQPGYSFLPVRERSGKDILELSKKAIANSGHEEYSMLSLCVSDYTVLQETMRELNREHLEARTSMSFPSQRADRMNLEVAEELKVVRKSGITLAPEAGTERLRAVINKGLNHKQIVNAIESAFRSGWSSIKLYYMCGLPTETDEDLKGIIDTLSECTKLCNQIRRENPDIKHKIEFTCTISNFVPKPHTPFQWYGQVTPEEFRRKHQALRAFLRESGLRNVKLNMTDTVTSLLESVISRNGRDAAELIYTAWKKGATFDAWSDRLKPQIWNDSASELGLSLEGMGCDDREVGSAQPWDVIHIGLHNWWLVKEWNKAIAMQETGNCTENTCHACGVCTELDTTHELANPSVEVMKKNPFVKELSANTKDEDSHPSLFFTAPPKLPQEEGQSRFCLKFSKKGDLRFIGHLDLQTLFVRAMRRAQLQMAYSQGFNPHPKLAFAGPLPLFMETAGDIADVELTHDISQSDFMARLNEQLPEEVRVLEVTSVSEKPKDSLASLLDTATYKAEMVRGSLNVELIQKRLFEMLDADELVITVSKKGKYPGEVETKNRDIKPGIKSLKLLDSHESGGLVTLEFELATNSSLHVKPSEVLELLASVKEDAQCELKWRVTRLDLRGKDKRSLFDIRKDASKGFTASVEQSIKSGIGVS